MRSKFLFLVLITTLGLVNVSCSTWDKLNNTERGAVIGGGTGAVVGGAAGNAGGAVLGGAAGAVGGGLIGHEMDDDHDHRHRR